MLSTLEALCLAWGAKQVGQSAYGFYDGHWDEINNMLRAQYQKLSQEVKESGEAFMPPRHP
jgi:hypothetical protein